MTLLCNGIKKNGSSCNRKTKSNYCYQHLNQESDKVELLEESVSLTCNSLTTKGKKCNKIRAKEEILCSFHLKKKPTFIEEKPKECPVCYEEFEEKDIYLECGHWVHMECVVKSGKKECPICRRKLKKISIEDKQKIIENIYRNIYSNNGIVSSNHNIFSNNGHVVYNDGISFAMFCNKVLYMYIKRNICFNSNMRDIIQERCNHIEYDYSVIIPF